MKVLFVCLGNICRSPTAEAVFDKLVAEHGLTDVLEVDSAGTNGFHIGQSPDPRSVKCAAKRGIDLTPLRGRQIERADFERFDYVIAMDDENVRQLSALCPESQHGKFSLLLSYADRCNYREVPDPYYGGTREFELVLDLIESGCRGLLDHLLRDDLMPVADRLQGQWRV
ncbi:MAG: low molecular weight protein-tyrosine-phosphatase [Betaproteobacteria bacterium]